MLLLQFSHSHSLSTSPLTRSQKNLNLSLRLVGDQAQFSPLLLFLLLSLSILPLKLLLHQEQLMSSAKDPQLQVYTTQANLLFPHLQLFLVAARNHRLRLCLVGGPQRTKHLRICSLARNYFVVAPPQLLHLSQVGSLVLLSNPPPALSLEHLQMEGSNLRLLLQRWRSMSPVLGTLDYLLLHQLLRLARLVRVIRSSL